MTLHVFTMGERHIQTHTAHRMFLDIVIYCELFYILAKEINCGCTTCRILVEDIPLC